MALASGTVFDVPELGVRVEVLQTAATTGGAAVEFELTGRPRGVIAVPHVHGTQTERHEVLSGELRISIGGRRHRLGPGESITVPAGTRHRQRAGRHGPQQVRVRLEPAGDFEAFVARLDEISRAGDYDRLGMPKPRAGARLLRDFGAGNRFAYVPLRAQMALARLLLRSRG